MIAPITIPAAPPKPPICPFAQAQKQSDPMPKPIIVMNKASTSFAVGIRLRNILLSCI